MTPPRIPSRLTVLWSWFGRPCRLLPRVQVVRGAGWGVNWLGAQLLVFRGQWAERVIQRVEGEL